MGFLGWAALLALALGVALKNAGRDRDSAVLGAYVVFYLVFCLFNTNFYASQKCRPARGPDRVDYVA